MPVSGPSRAKSCTEIPARPAQLNGRSLWLLGAIGAIFGSFYIAGVGQTQVPLFNRGGVGQFAEFWLAAFTPDLSREFLGVIGQAALVTLAYAVCGTTLSVTLGLVGGVLASESWWRTVLPRRKTGRRFGVPIWLITRGLLAFPRAIHELIWGLLLLNILGLDPLVAVLAIAIPFGAIVAKVFAEILDETAQKPLQVLINSGVHPLTAWLYGLLPQALPNLLSYTTYRFECSLRSAAVLGVIGAGGLGYELLLSLQSLRYDQLWTGFYALMILNGAIDLWSGWARRQMGFTSRLDLNAPQLAKGLTDHHVRSVASRSRTWGLRCSGLLIGVAIPLCFWALPIEWSRLGASRTRFLLQDIITSLVPSWPDGATAQLLLQLSGLTVAMSVVAIALAGLGGMVASFPAAQTFFLPGGWCRPNSHAGPLPPIGAWSLLIGTRLVLLISRAVPAPIWALVFLFVMFPGILPGALALAIHNFGILGRLMAEVNENLDDRPGRALQALGALPSQVMLYSVLPQNLARFLAYILYRWEVCMRETVIVGLVGAGGLGRLLTEQLSSFDYAGLLLTLGCFVILTFGVDLVSQQMRARLRE